MKKSLIALALMGAFSGAAFAQSNVTLYGIVDVNVKWEEGPTTVGTGTAARVVQESVTGVGAATSRVAAGASAVPKRWAAE